MTIFSIISAARETFGNLIEKFTAEKNGTHYAVTTQRTKVTFHTSSVPVDVSNTKGYIVRLGSYASYNLYAHLSADTSAKSKVDKWYSIHGR